MSDKYRLTMIKKYGSEEAWRAKMREWGTKGGKNSPGFNHFSAKRRKEIARKGWEKGMKKIFDNYRENNK